METLLISPAGRAEIVFGKFLAILAASVTTAVLNLLSMGLTGLQMARRAVGFGGEDSASAAAALAPPTLQSALWMIVLLIPLAAFFSAVCLAVAAMARSMKEGQYYMTPLYLICLPLIFLTMTPGIELNAFYSLVPVTGAALLLRALIVGDYATGFRYFIPVLVPTVIYAWLALRWAVEQFQDEEVLFRESERFNLVQWVKATIRDRGPRPSASQAVLCFALVITASWLFAQASLTAGATSGLGAVAIGQLLILLVPTAMAFLLTTDPLGTLRLRSTDGRYFALAAAAAVAVNPLSAELSRLVEWAFPLSDATKAVFNSLLQDDTPLPLAVLLFALTPAVCEEVAFRGFILSGLKTGRRPYSAIVLSALLFALLHVFLSLFQQFFNAAILGVFLGLLAVRSRSLLPCVLFHALNNGFAVALGAWVALLERAGAAGAIYRDAEHGLYQFPWVIVGAASAAALFLYLWRFDRPKLEGAE